MNLINTFIPALSRRPAPTAGENIPTLKPAFEIKETADAYGVTVHLPGVAKEGLELTVEDGLVRIVGRRAWQRPAGWTAVYRETSDAAYELALTHDNAINADHVAAELRDGVLRVSLPKTEALKPRKIAVN